jgi:hypothetical protein
MVGACPALLSGARFSRMGGVGNSPSKPATVAHTLPSSRNRMLLLVRLPWMRPAACAVLSASPICLATSTASSISRSLDRKRSANEIAGETNSAISPLFPKQILGPVDEQACSKNRLRTASVPHLGGEQLPCGRPRKQWPEESSGARLNCTSGMTADSTLSGFHPTSAARTSSFRILSRRTPSVAMDMLPWP